MISPTMDHSPTTPAQRVHEWWTLYYRNRGDPICRLMVSATPADQRCGVAYLARKMFGRHGKAEHGWWGPEGLPSLTCAVEGPDGTIVGWQTLARFATEWRRRRAGVVEPGAEAALERWGLQPSRVAQARRSYGLIVAPPTDAQIAEAAAYERQVRQLGRIYLH
jgi:hypothetical protein